MDNKNLLRNVQETGFALVEANLYLDAYPDCEQALAYFCEKRDAYNEAVAAYEKQCGPLTAKANCCSRWDWVSTPWPWEMGVN